MNEALEALAQCMNAIDGHFNDSETAFGLFSMRGAGGEDLVWLLRMAERYQILQKQHRIPWDDLRNPEPAPSIPMG